MADVTKDNRFIFTAGAWAGIFLIAMIPAQIFMFIKFPPPETVSGVFEVFNANVFLGLVNTDILYVITNVIMLAVYASFYYIMRGQDGEKTAVMGLIFIIAGVAAFISSSPSFTMMNLADKYFSAPDDSARNLYLAAGEGAMAGLTGSAYVVYYFMNAAGLLLISYSMILNKGFSKTIIAAGIASGFFMLIPSSFGAVGMTFSFLSLIPYTVWIILLTKIFLKKIKG
ncbi:MAG: hypothetical protein JXR81_09205 [Candidatus Goldbacteria bacterium]|nr:hypothetical protein [Candidatus Goldiibacteriota bacterium]